MAPHEQRINAIQSSDVSSLYAKFSSITAGGISPASDPTLTQGIRDAGYSNLFSGQTTGFNGFTGGAQDDGMMNINPTTLPGYNPFDDSTKPTVTKFWVG